MQLENSHIEEETLENYSRGALSEESAVVVEMHLLICQHCRQQLVAAEEFAVATKAAARNLRLHKRAPGRQRWSVPQLIFAFAALVLVVIAVAGLRPRHSAAAPFAVSLRTMRGASDQATAPAGRPLRLELDLTGLADSPTYRIEMVNQSGDRVWQGSCGNGAAAFATAPAEKQGLYFVRVALPSGETLREYGLTVRGTD